MAFADDVRRFAVKVEAKSKAHFVNTVHAVHQSIQDGSPITGAPGQPVQTGNLRGSWQVDFESPASAIVASSKEVAPYNQAIEDGVGPHGPLTLRSTVGGFHSVAKTINGFDRLVAAEAAKLADT